MKNAAKRFAKNIFLPMLILSLALVGCTPSDEVHIDVEYPSWYESSVFNTKNQETLPALTTYDIVRTEQINEKGEKYHGRVIVNLEYDREMINELLAQRASFKVTMIRHKIVGEQPPNEIEHDVITAIEIPRAELDEFDTAFVHPGLKWSYGISCTETAAKSGAISWRIEYSIIREGTTSIWYMHFFYIIDGDTMHVFKTYEDFYRFQKMLEVI